MRTVAIIQARMGSTRLPGKVLEEAAGKPLLQHMIERLMSCETLDDVVIALPEGEANQPIVDAIPCLERLWWTRGSESDVLGRVLQAAHQFGANVIVELTADCPLIDPALVDRVVKQYRYMVDVIRLDVYSTTRDSLLRPDTPYYPRGMDVRVFSREVLEDLDKLTIDDPVSREHVSLYAWEHRNRFHVSNHPAPPELCDDVRLTVDTPEDLQLVRKVFEYFASNDFSLADILALLDSRPVYRRLNRHVEQKAVR